MKPPTAVLLFLFVIVKFSQSQTTNCPNGFRATFYNNTKMDEVLKTTTISQLYYYWTIQPVDPVYGNRSEEWSAKFEAYFAPIKGIKTYFFRIAKDDTVKLVIDDVERIPYDYDYSNFLPTATVDLDYNVLHSFTVYFIQESILYALGLLWSIDGSCFSEIPPSLFYLDNCSVPNDTIPESLISIIPKTSCNTKDGFGLYGTYSIYNDSIIMNYSKIDRSIDFFGQWVWSWPDPICRPYVDIYRFNVTWRGSLCFDKDIVRLSISSCQPFLILIDGVVIANKTSDYTPATFDYEIDWKWKCRFLVLEYWSLNFDSPCYDLIVKWDDRVCVNYRPYVPDEILPNGVRIIDSSNLNTSFLYIDGSSIINGNLTLSSNSIFTLSPNIDLNVTGDLFLAGTLILNQTHEKKITTEIIISASSVSGSFDEIQVLVSKCQLVTDISQMINKNSFLLLFRSETTCGPLNLGGGIVAAIVASGFIGLVIIVVVVFLIVPSLRRKIFPFAFREP